MLSIRIKGKDRKFMVPRALLCGKSAYFEKAFQSHAFKEGEEGAIELDDDVKESLLECFVAWLYTGRIFYEPLSKTNSRAGRLPDEDSEEVDEDLPNDPVTWSYWYLVDLFVFADRYDTKALRNEVMDVIILIALQNNPRSYLWPSRAMYTDAYESLPESAPLLRLLIDIQTYESGTMDTEAEETSQLWELPHKLLAVLCGRRMRLMNRLRCDNCKAGNACDDIAHKDVQTQPDFRIDICRYHEHSENEKLVCSEKWKKLRKAHDIWEA